MQYFIFTRQNESKDIKKKTTRHIDFQESVCFRSDDITIDYVQLIAIK